MKVQLMVLMEALDHQKKKFSINFTKANTKFCLILDYNADNSYLFLNGKESLNLKPTIKMFTLQLSFVLKVYLMDLVLMSVDKYL